ncbi:MULTISPECIES: DUF6199 family natural product biosynthesis protein [unclassified Mycolicibacterium]|uniref:DUF6199 family natural product biosynthesis protein n=1 Tax=unclassified Mycolicibacterium TaxID=2636767 RepID=UPI0012DD0707|nr:MULTISPECIES: DUF6199 family natural product biosynthesis protein [unclassified Mycolicibacterium]MUL81074.1 hypothetical protein [Mycolicibacterium sp. CBMA 329]MUL86840.1 hypothetical protein [Mycolicibacterium sp. CBMA 331]MUL98875.1 hypothetical protein [Mycolicibacterium sp. CBMA 334]MUM28983.1 hypothetical protein [Mycolicibacterium sp. CBMA 295]MUM37137.1 hypothetical protein [Mycolicibacterium sp. CBMA 247]
MGPAIFIMIIGVLVGALMVAAPRGIWWATQSWRFRHPEANEPSALSYAMTRVGGVFVIVVALVLGAMLISNDLSKSAGDKQREQRRAAKAAFVVPPPCYTSAGVTKAGAEILPAAPGNVVPKLAEELQADP